jgi:hypothetical protein
MVVPARSHACSQVRDLFKWAARMQSMHAGLLAKRGLEPLVASAEAMTMAAAMSAHSPEFKAGPTVSYDLSQVNALLREAAFVEVRRVYVCVYVCVHVFVCVCLCVCCRGACAHEPTCCHLHFACVDVVKRSSFLKVRLLLLTHSLSHTHLHRHIHTYTYTHKHAHKHIYIHQFRVLTLWAR